MRPFCMEIVCTPYSELTNILPYYMIKTEDKSHEMEENGMKQVRITLCMLLLCLLCGCAKSTVTPNWAKQTTKPADKTAATKDMDSSGWQEQYDLGVRYLSDGNYEDAIIAFTAAIEIDPKKPQA